MVSLHQQQLETALTWYEGTERSTARLIIMRLYCAGLHHCIVLLRTMLRYAI